MSQRVEQREEMEEVRKKNWEENERMRKKRRVGEILILAVCLF